jgi:uncharacterized protein (TIGR03437 family)
VNPEQNTNQGATQAGNAGYDAFVSKISADGSTVLYSTYLGGNGDDMGQGIAVDSAGDAFITGWTKSTDFPIFKPYQIKYSSLTRANNVFVTKLNPAGNQLLFSTYLGGDQDDRVYAIALDSAGNPYITGMTHSSNFPLLKPIAGGANPTALGYSFVTKMSADGSSLQYSTFLNKGDANGLPYYADSIAVDSSGNACITGLTKTLVTVNALQPTSTGSQGVFVTKINAAGSAFVYSTYLDGSGLDQTYAIATDSSGNAYITGSTTSADFPIRNAFQSKLAGSTDVFLTKISPDGAAIVYSTYLGGTQDDLGFGLAVSASGEATVAGSTGSTNFPTVNPIAGTKHIARDLVVSRFSTDGSILFSTYTGAGSINQFMPGQFRGGLAVDTAGNAYVTGGAPGSNFPVSKAFQASFGGGAYDAFVMKIAPGITGPVVTSAVNGASFQAPIVPNSWAAIQGSGLATGTDTWDKFIVNGLLPTTVDGVSVTIGGKPASVYYISQGQINLLVPDVGPGSQQVVVTNSLGISAPFTATSAQYGPAFFPWPNNQVVATRQDFSWAVKNGTFSGVTTAPAKPGDIIILWGTGFGPTSPVPPAGQQVPSDQTYSTTTLPTVTINNVRVTVYGAALTPGNVGLFQIAIQVPPSLANGDWPIVASIGGVSSPGGALLSIHN